MYGQKSSRFRTDSPLANEGRGEGQEGAGARVGEVIRSGRASVEQAVSEYPLSTILGSFALGAAVGVALGVVLSESSEPRWYERVPDSLGRRWIESFLQVLPESVRSKVT